MKSAKELAAAYSAKVANENEALKQAKERAQADAQKVWDASNEVSKALDAAVVPFLEELKESMPQGKFNLRVEKDPKRSTLAVVFTIAQPVGPALQVEIGNSGGKVVVTRRVVAGTKILQQYTHPGSKAPGISTAADLTADKISALVELIIEGR
jgi:hypothetical protein